MEGDPRACTTRNLSGSWLRCLRSLIMTNRADPRQVRRFGLFATCSAVIATMVGLSGLAGWSMQIPELTNWNAAPVTMKANTSACFVLLGITLWLVRNKKETRRPRLRRMLALGTAAAAFLLGALSLAEALFKVELGIDPWLMAVPRHGRTAGSMSPLSACAFLALSFALSIIDWRTRKGRWPAQFLALGTGVTATFGLFSFAIDPVLYAAHVSVSLPTAVTCLVLSLGLVCVRTEWGLGALLCSRGMGGSLARRLLPAAFIPVAVGWIRWRIAALGLFSAWSIAVFDSLTTMSLLAATIAWIASLVERNDLEQQLGEEARDRLAAVIDSSDDGIISKTLDGTITAWNMGAEKLFGYSSFEAVGRDMAVFLPSPDPGPDLDVLGSGNCGYHFETTRSRKDGQTIDVSVTVSPIKDGGGMTVGVSNIARDITARNQAKASLAAQAKELAFTERALQKQTTLLQSVLDNISEGLVAADEHGHVVLWNPAAEKILGLGPTSLLMSDGCKDSGFFLSDTVTPLPADQTPLAHAVAGRASIAEMFVRHAGLPGGTWIEAKAHPMRDASGASHGGVVAFWDISQRRTTEQSILKMNGELEERVADRTAELAEANTALEAFTYSVAHDLRAPLRHISGFAGVLVEEFGPAMDVQALAYVERMRLGASKMGAMVDELLNLARVGRLRTSLQMVDLNLVVNEVIEMLQVEIGGRTVEWKIAPLPVVECDPVLVRVVFQNLISNALKYSRPRPVTVIEVGKTQEKTLFVRDNGVGFNMKYVDKIFGVFQRLHHDQDFEGMGVGLATVERIIKKHKGSIWAEAELQKGATFYFTIGEQAVVVHENRCSGVLRG